jgi:hypothetical protein
LTAVADAPRPYPCEVVALAWRLGRNASRCARTLFASSAEEFSAWRTLALCRSAMRIASSNVIVCCAE